MTDFDEADGFWESWTWSPGKEKEKKESKKDKNGLKCKNNMTMKTNENIQKKKKKKSSKCKDPMEKKKEKKREKKKNRMALERDDSFTQSTSTQAKPAVKKAQTLSAHSIGLLTPDQVCKKKSKKKKKVSFDLSPIIPSVKRPKCASSSQQSPKKSVLSENEAVRDGDSCSPVIVTGYSHGQTHADESQCTSEDINSQDLFITQKTFRYSSPSSDEVSDKALTTSPQGFTPRNKLHTSVALTKQHLEGPYKCPQDSHSHEHHRKTNEHMQTPKTLQVLLTEEEEEERLSKAHQASKKGKWFKANVTEEKIVSRPAHTTPTVLNACFLGVAKTKKHSCSSSQRSSSCLSHEPSVFPSVSMGSTSTQTENFFTTELSSYLNFCQKDRAAVHLEDLQPLDLSLPHRARKDLGMCLSVKTLEPNLRLSCSSDMNNAAVKQEEGHLWSDSTQGKRETTLSPQSQPEPKSTDTTISSEDEPPCRSGKLDLTQVRAVQMRLNESFFFKTKGEGHSPRPQSPLMKLVQGREVKNRKGH